MTARQSPSRRGQDGGGGKLGAADFAPAAARIGMVLLASDMQTEADFAAMKPPSVYVHAARLRFDNPLTAANLLKIRGRITAAARLIVPGEKLSALLFACTSASALIGDDKTLSVMRRAAPDTPCITPVSAALAGFDALGAKKVAILAPYTKAVGVGIAECIAGGGLQVASLACLGVGDDRRIARIKPRAIVRLAARAATADADALFLPCTNLRAVEVIEEIERKINKPVITSNQAMLWAALRAAGITAALPGRLGRT